ncbi:hypothetical protein [Haloimpatiens massiliensis]|uniref:hypothetical protein n=1 Tax=Haloimpatiens massiliensis TaxID=1658110 RepID=UPI000C82BB64|nr:hypothetical protein [Haloimpatiens massiliensis]
MDKNKELNTRVTLMNNKEWVHAISTLKTLKLDNKNKDYTIIYKKENQRKNREFTFHEVQYIEKTNSFIFTRFNESCKDATLTDEVNSKEVLMDIEIIDLEIQDKQNSKKFLFIN